MRSEAEMTALILGIAKADERVRAVLMNGSRANPNAPKDIYQDYDIAYLVTDIASFYNKPDWAVEHFGQPLIMQMPEAMRGADGGGHFNYQMIFPDGNRIDLSCVPISEENLRQYDCLTVTLLDKDGIVPAYPPPTDREFWLQEPSALDFMSCCNNFWWCLNNAVKGIARDELPYVMHMLNRWVRAELHDMIRWYIGTLHGFAFSAGKQGKYFKRYLPAKIYARYEKTYSSGDYHDIKASIDVMCDLFHDLALPVGARFGFAYRQDEEDGMREYLKMTIGADMKI